LIAYIIVTVSQELHAGNGPILNGFVSGIARKDKDITSSVEVKIHFDRIGAIEFAGVLIYVEG
jgi:hypothetical protein